MPPEQAATLARPGAAVVQRLAGFEPACLRAAPRVWKQWVSWAEAQGRSPLDAALLRSPLMVAEFAQAQGAARTSALRIWNTLGWMGRHLKAPFCLEGAFKPVPRDLVTGTVAPPAQATVAEPEPATAIRLREEHPTVFWCCVWYFRNAGLPHGLMLREQLACPVRTKLTSPDGTRR